MAIIVVGVDGSAESQQALEWALGQAESRGAELVVVHSYGHGPSDVSDTYLADAGKLEQARDAQRNAAEQLIEEALSKAGAEASGVSVRRELAPGVPPAVALLERAKDADLLVVGSRGLGGFPGMVLGSVSQQCAQHAPCPVLVFHPQAGD
jgi:nucleotide-binding universal stress UspA family protein